MDQIVLFKTGEEEFPLEIITHKGEQWITRKQLANALGVKDLAPLHFRLLRKKEIRENTHFTEFQFKENPKGGNPTLIIYSYKGIIFLAMNSEGRNAQYFRQWIDSDNILYRVMVQGEQAPVVEYHPPRTTATFHPRSVKGFIYVIRNESGKVKIGKSRNPLQRARSLQMQGGFKTSEIFISNEIADYDKAEVVLHERLRDYKYIGEWFDIGFEEAVKAYYKIMQDRGTEFSEHFGIDGFSELGQILKVPDPETPEPSTKDSQVVSVPKDYRAWNLKKRGMNKKGETIFKLVRNIRGKRYQKYLGVWNQEKADRLIDEVNQKYNTKPVSDAEVPKNYRGWNLSKWGTNKNGESIFNLVGNIRGKQHQKYLGVWNQEKADRLIDKLNQKYNSDTKPVSDAQVPKNYRGWNPNKRGTNKNGESIFNLVRKNRGKRYQKYLGVWNQEKADRFIDELDQKYDLDTKPVSQVPKNCRGWNLNKRGMNKNGEPIFNLVRKIRGKRHQKYLGVWNQAKADRLIDELDRKHGPKSGDMS
ncbi:GIY-YIG nuclease family protein [Desulfobacterales bacterium HSG2]|nr:GIY-YIG nuclease family protein [Desulfobacterales bacterium HSG2]